MPQCLSPISRGRVVSLTVSYVLGLSMVYTLVGLIAGMSGTMFGAVSSNPWLSVLSGEANTQSC